MRETLRVNEKKKIGLESFMKNREKKIKKKIKLS